MHRGATLICSTSHSCDESAVESDELSDLNSPWSNSIVSDSEWTCTMVKLIAAMNRIAR
jgi:hypothetical protein